MKQVIISTALTMLVGIQTSVGQTLKTYSGLYEDGKATYTYYEDENGERVKHGRYTYSRRDIVVGTYYVTGNYKNNRKDGKWTYKVTGRNSTRTLAIDYANGVMEGCINYTSRGNQERYQMINNRVIGVVNEKKQASIALPEAYVLTGQFDNEGFPDGTWVKDYEKDGNRFIDTEKYVHGILIAKQTKNESTGKIERSQFYIDPQKFVAAYSPDMDSVIIDGLICKLEMRFTEDETNYYHGKKPFFYSGRVGKYYAFASEEERDWQRLPDIEETIESPTEGEVFDMVERMPQFPGGQEKLNEYLSTHLQYPAEAKEKGIQGRVTMIFIVNRDGSISDAKVARGVEPSLDNEALRIINSMPHWIPGQQGGKNVRTRYTLTLPFRLQ